jgi:hypothetical protein
MSKSENFNVTEWDWFKLQLQIYALQRRAALFSFFFEFKEEPYSVVCSMHGVSIEDTLKEETDKSILYGEYFSTWVRPIKEDIAKVLTTLPKLGQEFDLEKDLQVEIMHDYGMGASLICRIIGSEVFWNDYILNTFKQKSNDTKIAGADGGE